MKTSNISPSDHCSMATMEAGGFDSMTFTPSDFSNMRRDDRLNICEHDADLLIEHMFERHKKGQSFISVSQSIRMVHIMISILCFTSSYISFYISHSMQVHYVMYSSRIPRVVMITIYLAMLSCSI